MSRIDDLVASLCPEGVEHKPLGEVGEFIRGNGLQKKDLADSGIGCIHYGQVFTKYGTTTETTVSYVAPELAGRLRKALPGDLVVATTSENDADVGKAVAWLGASEIAISGDAYVYRHSLDPRYAAYLFQAGSFQAQKRRHVTGTKVKRLSGERLARIEVPVPPPAVQREVGTLLSRLEAIETELMHALLAEAEARRGQRDHYRQAVLAHHAEPATAASWPTLDTLVSFTNGKPHERFVIDSGNVVLITPRFISTDGRTARCTDETHVLSPALAGDVAVVMSDLPNGRALARTFYVATDGTHTANQRVCLLRIVDEGSTDSRFLFHFLNRNPQLLRYDNGRDQTHLKKGDILAVRVPPLPLAEQRRIALMLDALDASVEELRSGLLAERRSRRIQYEHYRDHVLAFRPAAA